MTIKINLDPLDALRIFYEDETLGVWNGDFIKNEKQRRLRLPSILHDFLAKYGYLNVNHGNSQLWIPDKIDQTQAKVDGKLQDILIIGKLRGDRLAAILTSEVDQANPTLLLDELPEENGDDITLVFNKSALDLREFLILMFLESPTVYDTTEVYNQPNDVDELIQNYHNQQLSDLIKNSTPSKHYICYDDEAKEFLGLITLQDQTIVLKFKSCFAVRELENIFTKEFYENASNCNYQHALDILLRIINHLENVEGVAPELGEKYKLAGRCCWMLRQWNEAENWYKKAERVYKDMMAETLEEVSGFYETLGVFYFDKEDINKSQAAYQEVDRIGEFMGGNNPYRKGQRILRQAMFMAEAKRYQKAIDLYDQALAMFQQDPKDCKYDIARCQQLRSEARKALKAKTK